MMKALHPLAGFAAMALIATFWTATVAAELNGDAALIVQVKTLIPWGFLLLIPAIAAAGGSGFVLAGPRSGGVIDAKKRRMPIIVANGLLVLVPSALFLAGKARAGDFDGAFYVVQALELACGALNLWLMALNVRDGLKLRPRGRTAS